MRKDILKVINTRPSFDILLNIKASCVFELKPYISYLKNSALQDFLNANSMQNLVFYSPEI